ncbi:MAG: MBL fold metallo-hydrolase [Anaerolineae bacterium]|nr:MBL fold metallo-hydrolase [Anaerolineae bacterium]
MARYLCVTCGTQYPESDAPPAHCPICEDERQYVNPAGQQWTTLDELQRDRRNVMTELEPRLTAVRTEPAFAIGQRAHLIETPEGNILWDCISFLDQATIQAVQALGGIQAIAISHPHFYSAMVTWSRAFDDAPIYLHEDNAPWVMHPDPAVQYWRGDTLKANAQITLIRCGGHFDGSTALHWSAGAEGHGALFTADTLFVAPDLRHVSFMYSFPNLLPLPPRRVRQVAAAVQPYHFERIYGGWEGRVIASGGSDAVQRSAERYLRLIAEG